MAVPSTNIDGASPADIARIEVYALDGPGTLTTDDVLRSGRMIKAVAVEPPQDPDAVAPEVPLTGVAQGTQASLEDPLALVAEPDAFRSYVAVGINGRGRRGPVSPLGRVPLAPSPAPPTGVGVSYSESAITIAWSALAGAERRYHVYATEALPARLTTSPVDSGVFEDPRIAWGERRCYEVRAVDTVASFTVEGEPSAPSCVVLQDTFPPQAPTGLRTVPEVGGVNLIWSPSQAADVIGYLVLRGATGAAGTLSAVTPSPITETTFRDAVASGTRVTYAVQAVDRAGNRSAPSEGKEETAR